MEIAALFRLPHRRLLIAVCLGFALLALAQAWVAEDAYITFRVIDNFFGGYGLRWNIHERVQAYTHPLWMLLELLLFAVWENLFLVAIALGVACSAAAVTVTLATAERPLFLILVGFILPLLTSKSFMQYTTSGMENSLSYLCFAFFGYVIMKRRGHPRFWLYLSLAVSLAMLTRLDAAILYAPVILCLMAQQRVRLPWRQIALGLAPLFTWCAFALFYYGFIFPNPKYAKLDTGLPTISYLRQGLFYLKFMVLWDTPGLVMLALPCLTAWQSFRKRAPEFRIIAAIALGIYAYCIYVITIGGDYMAGRFWALPVFASVWLWHMCWQPSRRTFIAFLCVVAMTYAMPFFRSEVRAACPDCDIFKNKVIDARAAFRKNGLVASFFPPHVRTEGKYYLADKGRKLAKQRLSVQVVYFVGMAGYHAGPAVTLIDELALADPLLARLPARKEVFYIGHFRRAVPPGYIAYLTHGSLKNMPEPLARYYEKLHLITAGDLLSPERLKTIVLFNLGYYDDWKHAALAP